MEVFKPEIVEAVKEDYEYLQKMKEMDSEISLNSQSEGEEEEGGEEVKRKFKMTDVVPVGGLIMARFFFSFFFFNVIMILNFFFL